MQSRTGPVDRRTHVPDCFNDINYFMASGKSQITTLYIQRKHIAGEYQAL